MVGAQADDVVGWWRGATQYILHTLAPSVQRHILGEMHISSDAAYLCPLIGLLGCFRSNCCPRVANVRANQMRIVSSFTRRGTSGFLRSPLG